VDGHGTPEVKIECVRVDEGGEVRISNRWRLGGGREDEWSGNYGILIEEFGESSFVLRCSDGIGDQPSFHDLVGDLLGAMSHVAAAAAA
jgi:hypothetical protein